MLYAICYMLYAICYVLCVMCYVLCAIVLILLVYIFSLFSPYVIVSIVVFLSHLHKLYFKPLYLILVLIIVSSINFIFKCILFLFIRTLKIFYLLSYFFYMSKLNSSLPYHNFPPPVFFCDIFNILISLICQCQTQLKNYPLYYPQALYINIFPVNRTSNNSIINSFY